MYKVLLQYSRYVNVSTQLIDYNLLAISSQTSVTITCGVQPTGMAMKVLHNTTIMW